MSGLLSRIGACALLIILSPILAVLAMAAMAGQGRPVLFRQKRAGKHALPFVLLKFRSMRDLRDATGKPLPDADRTTKVGAFLRRSRLDELPGLLNVARGEMAWVGPRPLLPKTIDALGADGLERCAVRPGLTGLSQVSGNTLLSLEDKVALDIWYIRNRNWLLDLKIILLTIGVMLFGETVRSRPLAVGPASSREQEG